MSVYVIAEAGVNHNGNAALALRMVDVAANAGANAVKFQIFRTDSLVTAQAPKAGYQQRTTDAAESQRAMLCRLELRQEDFHALAARCKARGVDFMASPFDTESIDFLAKGLGCTTLKLPSGEVTNGPFLLAAARTGCSIVLSTGMSNLDEVREALDVLAWGYLGREGAPHPAPEGPAALKGRVTLLHCTSEYPTPFVDVNLRAMDSLREAFGLPVGLSDHTTGIVAPIAAVARGACLIEKHFTLDASLPGPDHKASLEPGQLAAMIAGIRQVEDSMGDGIKVPRPSEMNTRQVARRSLVATRPIAKGEAFTPENMAAKRPGGGLSPMRYWDLLGKPAGRDYALDEPLVED